MLIPNHVEIEMPNFIKIRITLVVQAPFVLGNKVVDHFFHCIVWNQHVLGQFGPCDWVEMADPLQMLSDVPPVVCDSARCNHWILQDLEAYFAAHIVGHLPACPSFVHLCKKTIQLSHSPVCFSL